MDDVLGLERDVSAIAKASGRRVGTEGHDDAKQYLLGRFGQLHLLTYQGETFELTYESGGQKFSNLVGVVPGENRGLPPILIGAHYDSVISSYCADDNAAAVAITLLAAEKLMASGSVARDVAIALFDAEEPPYFHSPEMGSTRFYRDQRRPEGFHAALIMDLVGHDVQLPLYGLDAQQQSALAGLVFMTGAESHPSLPQVVRNCCPRPDLPVVAALNRSVGDMSDHHVFRQHGVPYLFLSCGRWPHYHQPTDTPDKLNYEKMARICDLLISLCRSLTDTDLSCDDLPRESVALEEGRIDTTSLEIELIENVFGRSLTPLLHSIGMTTLKTREDLDELAARFQGFFEL